MAEFAMATPSAPPRPSKDDVVDAGREREVDVVLDVLGRHLEADGDAAGLFTHLVGGGAEVVCGHQVREPGRADRGGALLYAGANVNARLRHTLWFTTYNRDLLGVDRAGATPFWCAAHATDVPAMKLLLEYGADPDLPTIKVSQRGGGRADRPDPSGLPPVPMGGPAVNPIHAAAGVGYGQGYAGNSHRHAPEGWMPTMRFLVEELGAGVNARDINGYTPVHHAAARGDNEMILYLVEKGADVTAVARNGRTTADMANGPVQRIQPFPATVALLERLGAKNNHRCVSC